MPFMILRTLSIAFIACLIVGCGPKAQSYDVAVRNNTNEPLTVWLTKRGNAPIEQQWLSPEDVAIRGTGTDKRIAGIVVQPGEARGAQLGGKFPGNSSAVLRVYRGQLTLDEMLATHEVNGKSRLDVPLTPGLNHLIVKDNAGALTTVRSTRFAPATKPAK